MLIFCSGSVGAQLPASIDEALKKELGSYKERLDKVLVSGEQKWLLLKADKSLTLAKGANGEILLSQSPTDEIQSEPTLLAKTKDKDLLFSNAWIYTPIVNNSIKSFDHYPELFQDVILQSKIHQEFIVPKGFQLPRDLAFLAGRIPVTLASIQLASDREVIYRERMKKLKDEKDFEFLTYSYESGKLAQLTIDKDSNQKLGEAKDLQAEEFGLKYLSSIREYEGELYFADLISGSIFSFGKDEIEFDATKLGELAKEHKLDGDFKVKEVFKLGNLGVDDGIKDFAFGLNKSKLYLLTKITSQLLIVDFRKKVIQKTLDLPKMIDGFQLLSRSSQEPDKLVFFSKAQAMIFFLNTYDLRISDQITLSKIDKENNYIPYSVLVSRDKIFLGVEKRSKLKKSVNEAGLMVFDSITNVFSEFINLASIPKKMMLSKDNADIFILAESLQGEKTQIVKISTKTHEEKARLELDADIAQSSSMTELFAAELLAVPSSVSNNIVLIDSKTLMALKKIELKEPVNLLKLIN